MLNCDVQKPKVPVPGYYVLQYTVPGYTHDIKCMYVHNIHTCTTRYVANDLSVLTVYTVYTCMFALSKPKSCNLSPLAIIELYRTT